MTKASLPSDLLAVAATVSAEPALLQTLADGGQPVAARQGIVRDLFADKIGAQAIDALCDVVAKRWSGTAALVEAIEVLAATEAFAAAGKSLDEVEDQIFAFGRVLDSSAELQMAVTNPSASAASVEALVRELLGSKVDPTALAVLAYFTSHLRGRRVDAVIDMLSGLAAQQNNKAVAEVRSVVELSDKQKQRLAAAIEKLTGRAVRVNVAIDPTVIGGISVNVAGEIFDGTVATRLEHARRALLA